jgi:macrodomain Ter protein organizer (MatP/YcbG family)
MPKLSKQEREEMTRLAASSSLREDMAYLASHRHNPVLVNGVVDMDRLLDFLNQYNEFINHEPKPFVPMSEKEMKL